MENEIETLKKMAWIKFLQLETQKTNKQTKKQIEFLTFFEVYTVRVFFSGIFPGLWVNFLVMLSYIPYKKLEELLPACLFEVFIRLWLSTSTFCIKGYDYVEHFVRVLVLLVINAGCLQKFLKNGENFIVDFQFNLC